MMKLNPCCIRLGTILSLLACGVAASAHPGGSHEAKLRAVAGANLLPDAPAHPPQTVDEALAAFHQQLVRDHEQQFSPLLTRQTVLNAVRSTQQGYKAHRSLFQGSLTGDYYQKNLALMQQIASGGSWPRGAFLSAFYQLTDAKGVTYRGIGVRLVVLDPQHPGQQLPLSSWPILDVWYGRIE